MTTVDHFGQSGQLTTFDYFSQCGQLATMHAGATLYMDVICDHLAFDHFSHSGQLTTFDHFSQCGQLTTMHAACRCYSIHGLGIYMYRIFKYYISMNILQ